MMPLRVTRLSYLYSAVIFLVLLAAFQNCGSGTGGGQAGEPSISGLPVPVQTAGLNSLPYPYAAKPEFYLDLVLYRPTGSTGPFLETEFIGSATPTSGQLERLEFRLSFVDNAMVPVCPPKTGILEKSQTLIRYKCIARSAVASIKVILAVTSLATGKTQTSVRTYL
jgi:hypothetical protein